jgi:hypothetical protein
MNQRNNLNKILKMQLALLNDENYAPVVCFPEKLAKVSNNHYSKKGKGSIKEVPISH